MKVSVITPTCDRPVGFSLAERWMARQTRQPDEWIVADGGRYAAVCTQGQVHLHKPMASGVTNFTSNLIRAIDAVKGEIVVVFEDDDYYAPTHLETLVARLERGEGSIAGDDEQRYYNIDRQCYRTFQNTGASLCQTAFLASRMPAFRAAVECCQRTSQIGVDWAFWTSIPRESWSLVKAHTVLGTKGLPGQPGLGIGHRPDGQWTADPTWRQLVTWIGAEDAAVYAGLRGRACA